MGPVIIDLASLTLDQEEHELLQHPLVCGVILFARNYESPEQLSALCQSIRTACKTPLLILVDQEGGRVQRFRDGFLSLPSMGEIGSLPLTEAEDLAYLAGWLMASELLACGVDLSLAPVLDLDKHLNRVVGDRAFSGDPIHVSQLAMNMVKGMSKAGMASTGKHFPGHGSVDLDSHLALPMDPRDFSTIYNEDMQPFINLIQAGIHAIMPAHILFPAVDNRPVGFSRKWLQDVLRNKLKFTGVIFSDDLNMAGADFAGNYAERAVASLDAGCDITLICNNRKGAIEILDTLPQTYHLPMEKFNLLRGKYSYTFTALHKTTEWCENADLFAQYRKLYEPH